MSDTPRVTGKDWLASLEEKYPGAFERIYFEELGKGRALSELGERPSKGRDFQVAVILAPFARACGVAQLTGSMVGHHRMRVGMVHYRKQGPAAPEPTEACTPAFDPLAPLELRQDFTGWATPPTESLPARVEPPVLEPQPVLPLQEDHEGEFASVKRMLGGIIGRLEKIGERVERLESGALPLLSSPVPQNWKEIGKEGRHV